MFIELSDGFCVNSEAIQSIQRVSPLETRVNLAFDTFTTLMPFEVVRNYLVEEPKVSPMSDTAEAALQHLVRFSTRTTP